MYKVFNQHRAIIFTETLKNCKISTEDLIVDTNRLEDIISTYQKFINEKSHLNLIFVFKNELVAAVHRFFSNFKLISAAGGVVVNLKGELLMIRRFSKWDLPKGKIEENEQIQAAAIRECMEETALQSMEIKNELESSYHIYEVDTISILKRTYWFAMKTASDNRLIPQLEEGIEDVKWMNKNEVKEALNDTYESLKELITHNYLQQ